jgi:hypothetical protein
MDFSNCEIDNKFRKKDYNDISRVSSVSSLSSQDSKNTSIQNKTSNLRENLFIRIDSDDSSENTKIVNPLYRRKMMYLPKSHSPCNIDASDNKIKK